MLLVQGYMGNVDGGRAHVLELLLELEETILYLLLDVFGKGLLRANQFWVLRMSSLLHDATAIALERLLELVDASVRHRHLLVALYLLGGLRCDAVDC